MIYYYKNQRILAPVTYQSNEPSWSSEAISLKDFRTAQPAQRWEITFNIKNNESLIDMFLGSIVDFNTAQYVVMPQFKEVNDKVTAVAGTAASTSAGSSTVVVSGLNGLLPKGSFISFTNHTKLYITKNDVTNSGTLQLYPNLVSSVSGSFFHPGTNTKPSLFCKEHIDNERGILFEDGILAKRDNVKLIEEL